MVRMTVVVLLVLATLIVDAKGIASPQILKALRRCALKNKFVVGGKITSEFISKNRKHEKSDCLWECVSLDMGITDKDGKPNDKAIGDVMENQYHIKLQNNVLQQIEDNCYNLHQGKSGKCKKIPAVFWCLYDGIHKANHGQN